MKATSKSSSRKANLPLSKMSDAAMNRMGMEEFADKLVSQLEGSPPPLDINTVSAIERATKMNPIDRCALIFLTKPSKEMHKTITTDREAAVAFADIYQLLPDRIKKYKGLCELLESAEVRLMVALAMREDMQAVLKEASHE